MTRPPHAVRFPGESEEYRRARNELLEAELELRERLERVAALRRTLPRGGRVKEDYVFDEAAPDGAVARTRLSELFAPGKRSLIVYSFMFGPEMATACPMCTSFLDGMDAYAPHVRQRVTLAVVARSPIERIRGFARQRGWKNLRLLSSGKNGYNGDYLAETPNGEQIPACNVFVKDGDGVFHFWAAEMLYARTPGHPRHLDLLWPIWSYFDLTPEGRGDWMPRLAYD
jgi:predicted dithiol-disulfide oxidoreductase (DUF899 family)